MGATVVGFLSLRLDERLGLAHIWQHSLNAVTDIPSINLDKAVIKMYIKDVQLALSIQEC
jgi:hypothetical protein